MTIRDENLRPPTTTPNRYYKYVFPGLGKDLGTLLHSSLPNIVVTHRWSTVALCRQVADGILFNKFNQPSPQEQATTKWAFSFVTDDTHSSRKLTEPFTGKSLAQDFIAVVLQYGGIIEGHLSRQEPHRWNPFMLERYSSFFCRIVQNPESGKLCKEVTEVVGSKKFISIVMSLIGVFHVTDPRDCCPCK